VPTNTGEQRCCNNMPTYTGEQRCCNKMPTNTGEQRCDINIDLSTPIYVVCIISIFLYVFTFVGIKKYPYFMSLIY
jgi:hypothetical protein